MSLLTSRPSKPPQSHATEFDVLKASHKFLRDDIEDQDKSSWNDQLAQKYYSNLFREFAVCDLKHYKSGNFSLRWRTESEVLSGAGETTCGNTRCIYHQSSGGRDLDGAPELSLTTLELPFAYEERGEMKSALVKVVLCGRCCKKLMWKRNREKDGAGHAEASSDKHETRKRKRGSSQVGGRHIEGAGREEHTSSFSTQNSGYHSRRHDEHPARRNS